MKPLYHHLICVYIKGYSGFILSVYIVYIFHMSMQLIQREMHVYIKDTVASYGLFTSYVNAVDAKT